LNAGTTETSQATESNKTSNAHHFSQSEVKTSSDRSWAIGLAFDVMRITLHSTEFRVSVPFKVHVRGSLFTLLRAAVASFLMLLGGVVLVLASLVLFVFVRWLQSLSKEDIFAAYSRDVSGTKFVFEEDPRMCGDELGDAFLAAHGPVYIYESKDIARELGLRSMKVAICFFFFVLRVCIVVLLCF
jgi:Ca2+/Na+ antiporter